MQAGTTVPGVDDLGESVHGYGSSVTDGPKSYIERKSREQATEKAAEAAIGDKTVILGGLAVLVAFLVYRNGWDDEITARWDAVWAWTMELVTPLRNVSPGGEVPSPADEPYGVAWAFLLSLTVVVGALGQSWLRWLLRVPIGSLGAVVWLGAAGITAVVSTVLASATLTVLGTWTAAGIMGGHMARTHYRARKP